jgi:prepilin-type processing-associated H-X9-DG protein
VVPLLPVDEMAKLPSPLTIQPAADGRANIQYVDLHVQAAAEGGSTYTVTVKRA